MRIEAIETLRLEEFGNLLWVVVHADDGLAGLGETFFGPQAVEAYIFETAAPLLLGQDPRRIERLSQQLQGYVGTRGSGVETRGASAIDIALWDLWGKSTGQPLWQLLGGRYRESVRTYNTCAGYRYVRSKRGQHSENWGLDCSEGPYEDLDAFLHRPAELAQSLLAEGISAMKIWPFDRYAEQSGGLHIEPRELRAGMEPFEKIREAVGGDMDVMLECHSLWNLPAATQIARALEPFDVYWIEDPIRMHSLADLGEFRRRTRQRVTASETLAGMWGFRDLIDADAADVLMPDLSWVGGLTQARKICALAEAHSLPVAPHDCTGPVVFTASTHLSIAAPNALFQESVRAFYTGWYREILDQLPTVARGTVSPPQGDGLGVSLLPNIRERKDATCRRMTVADL